MKSRSFTTDFLKKEQSAAYSGFPKSVAERFNILECIGNTDFGETFLLSEKQSGDLYVLKSCRNAQHSASNETALLRGLKHPGLPCFEELELEPGEDANVSVRRFIDGVTLCEYIEDEEIMPYSISPVDTVIKLCDVLSYLHSQPTPIIHRDIKPSNIIIIDSSVTLIDFGIARKYSENSDNDTAYFGTEKYSPPEQYGFAQTDCRTDIYSLGVVMRYWLSGTTDRSAKIDNKSLERIVAKCTALAPESRFQSANALKKALNAYKYRNRRKAIKIASASAALLICGGVATMFALHGIGADTGREEPFITTAPPTTTTTASPTTTTAPPTATTASPTTTTAPPTATTASPTTTTAPPTATTAPPTTTTAPPTTTTAPPTTTTAPPTATTAPPTATTAPPTRTEPTATTDRTVSPVLCVFCGRSITVCRCIITQY